MKKFLIKNKKITLTIFIILIIVLILIFEIMNKRNIMSELNMNNYILQYDNTWKLTKKEELEVNLLHKKSESELNIKIKELQDEAQYNTIDELFDSILYNIQEQNSNYKLIYKEKSKITKQNIDGYKVLFEFDDGQATKQNSNFYI